MTLTHKSWKSVLAVAAIAAIGAGLPTARSALVFDPPVSYGVGQRPSGVAGGDFDGDGLIDLATTTDTPDKLELLMNIGMGGFAAGAVIPLPGGSGAGELVAGDLDGDLDVDLAVALKNFATVMVLTNNGGSFSLGAQFATGLNPRGMTIADMDADGDLDIAVANRDSNTATVLENTGAGSFVSTSMAVGDEPRDAAFIDFGGDAALDLAVTNHRDRNVSLLINSGGVFTPAGTLFVGAQVRPDGITAADLDGNGETDLATATSGNGLNYASVFLNTGGVFSGPFNYPVGGVNPSDIVAADFDCDVAVELVTSNSVSGDVSVLPNLGGGVFGAATMVGAGAWPGTLAAADFTGSDSSDIAVSNRDSNSVTVALNANACGIPGDVDGDGDVDFGDLAALLASYGLCAGDVGYNPDADFNGDGCVGFGDLATLLANYGI